MLLIANAVKSRLTRQIALFGQSYTYKRGASSTTAQARITVMNNSTKFAWFTSTETAGWTAVPAYVVTIAGDFQPFSSSPAAGDLITIKGVDYNVRKFDVPKIGSTIVKTVLYCAKI